MRLAWKGQVYPEATFLSKISFIDGGNSVHVQWSMGRSSSGTPQRADRGPIWVYSDEDEAMIANAVDCITNQGRALVDGIEGRRSIELISAIYESVAIGKEVRLRFKPHYNRLGKT